MPDTVDLRPVYEAIDKAIGKVQRHVDTVDRDSRSRDREIAESVYDLRKYTENEIKRLYERIEEVANHLAQLMEQVRDSFASLSASVGQLQTITEDGNRKIVNGIDRSEVTSREGLQKVSTGVALVDVLKASADAAEMGMAIRSATADIEGRMGRVRAEIARIRESYDKRAEEAYLGFEDQVMRIGGHIVEIQDLLEKTLDGLRIDGSADSMVDAQIGGAQRMTTKHRARVLEGSWKQIDAKRLGTFSVLQEHLSRFISDDRLVRFLRPPPQNGDDDEQDVPAFGLPVVAVRLSRCEFTAEAPKTAAYCLDVRAVDCNTEPVPVREFGTLTRTIEGACGRLESRAGAPLDDDSVDALVTALDRLVNARMLHETHAEMIKDHLKRFPLIWLDSPGGGTQ